MEARKSWWRRGLWWKLALALIVLAGFFAPAIASPLVRSLVSDAIGEQVGGRASFESFRLSWPLNLHAGGFRVEDGRGRPLATLAAVEASLEARALVAGRLAVDVHGEGAEVHVYQGPDGSWSFGQRREPAGGATEPTPGGREGEPTKSPPSVHGGVWFTGGRAVLHGTDGDVVLSDLELGGTLPREPNDAATLHLSFRAPGTDGPEGPGGSLRLDGTAVLGPLERIEPGEVQAELELDSLTLAALRPVLAASLPGRIPGGSIDGSFTLEGGLERVQLQGGATVHQLEIEVVSEGERTFVLRDPETTLAIEAELSTERLDLSLASLSIDSGFLSGTLGGRVANLRSWIEEGDDSGVTFDGVQGELTYVPDQIAPLLGPDLPFELSGSEQERIAFALEGSAAEADLASLLQGCRTSATIGLGSFATTGIAGKGELQLEAADGRAHWAARLAANGGTLGLDGDLAVPDGGIGNVALHVDAQAIETNAELAPLLSLVHPAFAAVEALQRSEVAGLVTCQLELGYADTLSAETLAAGWEGFPKAGIQGRGSFRISGARLSGSPALQQMLAYLGVDATRSLDIRPVEFTIDGGRLNYGRPWTWTIDGTETTFTGSVGLDQTLDLAWNVPVTAELVERHRLLSALSGQAIRLPIVGTVKSPRLEWKEALSGLANETLREEVKDELLGALGVGDREGKDDPATLLAEADRLWEAGKKAEAAPIYSRIREEFKLTLVYALNRDRIKEREKYRE